MNQGSTPSPEVESFARNARKFCEWLEGKPADPGAELRNSLVLTSRLFDAAVRLPFDLPPPGHSAEPVIAKERRNEINKRCAALPFQYYSEVFDPFVIPAEEPVIGDIADDLTDIYCDICGPLDQFDAGDYQSALAWWSFSFACHWGEHATSALRALYCYLRQSAHD